MKTGLYRSLGDYLAEQFGEKLYKLSLDGGMSCPNRDGTVGSGGCIFCLDGSSAFSQSAVLPVEEQIKRAKALVASKCRCEKFIAYFQSYSNTYAPVDRLKELFLPVITRPDVAVLDIATRPDCLPDDVLELLEALASIKPVWVELGLQTVSDVTARLIRRGYDTSVYDDAVKKLHSVGAQVITHVILGLPGEDHDDMERTVRHVAQSGADGIKLQLLHVLRGTELAEMYARGQFSVMELSDYAAITARLIAALPPRMVVHRITGDGDRRSLVAPLWSLDKKRVLGEIERQLTLLTAERPE